MKSLFIGGIKSGKSLLAEQYTLEFCYQHNLQKPIYLATSEFIDEEMQERINKHQQQRQDSFITIEESLNLSQTITHFDQNQTILIECISIWLNNMLYHKYNHDKIFQQINNLLKLPQNIIFVQNDVGNGIIPDNKLAREYIDLSGKISQHIAESCQEVYFCIAGLKQQIK